MSNASPAAELKQPLKLAALDATDLEIVSAHMQDAVIKLADIRYLAAKQKFVLIANRFVWDAVHVGKRRPFERRRSGLQLARVLTARSSGIAQNLDEAVLCLLSIGFEPGRPPSGTTAFNFAGRR